MRNFQNRLGSVPRPNPENNRVTPHLLHLNWKTFAVFLIINNAAPGLIRGVFNGRGRLSKQAPSSVLPSSSSSLTQIWLGRVETFQNRLPKKIHKDF